MYRNLFTAWYCLGVLTLCLGTFLILIPMIGVWRAYNLSYAVSSLFGFLPFFWFIVFRKTKEDERDVSFRQRAASHGFAYGWGAICLLHALIFFIHFLSGSDSVALEISMVPLIGGGGFFILAFSVMLLRFYYKGEQIGMDYDGRRAGMEV